MDDINISSNKLIRNIIVVLDMFVLWAVMLCLMKYGEIFIARPLMFIILGTVAMMVGQTWFSTLLHHHYSSIDKVLSRTTALMFTFGCSFLMLCTLHKWTRGVVADGRVIGMVAVLSYVAILTSRIVETSVLKYARKHGRNQRSICFVGEASLIKEIVREIDYNVTTGLKLKGYFAPQPDDDLTEKMAYFGDYEQLGKVLDDKHHTVDEMYCALPPSEKELNKRLITHCLEHVVRFYYVPAFMNEFGDYLKPSMIGQQVVFANFSEPLLSPTNRMIKRVFDVVSSFVAIVILLPFLPIVALIIKIQSPGPIFFKQARTGIGGEDFMMLKFRSMHVNADSDKLQATKNDPRKFPFGNFMRRTSIDELPQLWNILMGDMSVVGPRPHMRAHTEEYRHLIEYYMMRHYIRPGLTGWAQTTGYRGETSELWQMEGRVRRDIWYIQNWSFWLDIRIILRTVWQVIGRDKQAY